MKVKILIIVLIGINLSLNAQQFGNNGISNNAFKFSPSYGDLQMRRYISGDTVFKRALIPTSTKLIMNYGGDFSEGTRIMGSNLTLDGYLTVSSKINLNAGNNEGITIGNFNDQLNWNGSGEQPGYHIRFAGYRDVNPNIIGAKISALRTNLCCSGKAQGMELVFSIMQLAGNGLTGDSNLIEALRIKSDGNVGIGTTDTKGFKLGVKGKIAAEEVKVALHSNWADFVFNENYKLPTLAEVENHIKEKGHLKDIPSSKEVKENGIFLGEMDSKLLQKIEELTLYTIQQENKIKEQAEKIENLESLNKKLLDLQKRVEKLENK